MALDLLKDKGTSLDRQRFTWKELVQQPYSKLNDDAFTRVRVILMNGIESEAIRFSHAAARMNRDLQLPLAQVRRVEQHQQTLVNWLHPGDQNPLETTLGFEQVAIEITAAVARREPDPYLAQVYRYGLLEDFDHLYRYSALYDRLEGKDPNTIVQSYSDIIPGRPTIDQHRAPDDDLREAYDRSTAAPLTKLHAYTIMAAEHQTHDYYMNVGPFFSDPLARQLYAEIASIEEQHVTQYESIIDSTETWLEKWLLHEATEAYNYWSCVQHEKTPRIKALWERLLDYELGHVRLVAELFKQVERRDPAEVLPNRIDAPMPHESNRAFVRDVLEEEVNLHAVGRSSFVDKSKLPKTSPSIAYRQEVNAEGSPTNLIASGWKWIPGTEVLERAAQLPGLAERRLQ